MLKVLSFLWVLALQDYSKVKYKKTGHSNAYFPQACFVGYLFICLWNVINAVL
jgi:hypothetical protein